MEGYEYPKKPESEHRFTEFLRTSEEIEALRQAIQEVQAPHGDEVQGDTVFIDEERPLEKNPFKTSTELRLELEEKIKRYNALQGVLAEESNPKE